MRILLTGAAGMAGRYIAEQLSASGHVVIPIDVAQAGGIIGADLANESDVSRVIEEHAPDLVLHLAAITSLNYCENNKAASRRSNFETTRALVEVCADKRLRLIFFSSDYVFGAEDRLWREHDAPCPTTQYGKDKAASETMILRGLQDFAIVRTAQIYGLPGDFVGLVYDALLSGDHFKAYSNLVNCPTWVGDLHAMVDAIVAFGYRGIFHCVGPEASSRYDFALAVAAAFSLDTDLIHPEALDFSKDIRPSAVRLDGTSTYKTLRVSPGRLQDNLPLCLHHLPGRRTRD